MDEIEILVDIFMTQLQNNGISVDDAEKAFDYHLCTSKQFPLVSDIISAVLPITCYKLNGGPLGFGAIYPPDHPYVRYQMTLPGVRLSSFAVKVRAIDPEPLEEKAKALSYVPLEHNDVPSNIVRRNGSGGFKTLDDCFDGDD